MKLTAKRISIETGFTPVVTINHRDAIRYDLHPRDRVLVEVVGDRKRKTIAVVDVIMSDRLIKQGTVGVLVEAARDLCLKDSETLDLHPAPKPDSVRLIQKKMEGAALSEQEYDLLVKDIVHGALTEVELAYFVSAAAMRTLTLEETTSLTRAITKNGSRFDSGKSIVVDKHCIGGVPGNRTTMVVVPILTAFGLTMPKTSSRAITSPAGTADTMETLANVSLSLDEMHQVVSRTGGCMVWGGSLGLAPADDKIIRIEKPMSIDAQGLMLASVMAKKHSVGATHVVIDIPYGQNAKVETQADAQELRGHFLTLGTLLGMKLFVVLTDGTQPIGRGIGPALEAQDVMAVLRNDKDAPQDLREKALMIASQMLEFTGSVQQGAGRVVARDILDSGNALKKMEEIIAAQGKAAPLRLGSSRFTFKSARVGTITQLDNKALSKLARMAGAPITKGAGLFLHKKVGDKVRVGDTLYTAYADSAEKLRHVKLYDQELEPFRFR